MIFLMELEFEKFCVVDGSPKTVLPSRSRVCKKTTKERLIGNDEVRINNEFMEISFHRYRCASCRSIPSRNFSLDLEGIDFSKRGSVYQSSYEVRKMKGTVPKHGRKKIEMSQGSSTTLSFEIVDSLCSSDDECLVVDPIPQRSSIKSNFMKLCSQNFSGNSFDCVPEEDVLSGDFLEISPDSNDQENLTEVSIRRRSIENPRIRVDLSASPLNDCNGFRDSGTDSRSGSPKTRFSPIRKMFDPFGKLKPQKSPLSSTVEIGGRSSEKLVEVKRNKSLRKSLLQDFSNTTQNADCGSPSTDAACSPSHLHGILKVQNKHGLPFFEFSVRFPEDIFVAKTWKDENTSNWVYTFHSIQNRRKSNATSGWELKESNKASSMVGQMQVSCYSCTKLEGAGAFDDSMVTEFVLYDIAHARRNLVTMGNFSNSPDAKNSKLSNESLTRLACEFDEVSNELKLRSHCKHGSDGGHQDLSTSHPWVAAELHPNLETAAIVVQFPFGKRESLKSQHGGKNSDQLLHLFDLAEAKENTLDDPLSPLVVNIVIPFGNHSSPGLEDAGPSSLLDRWKLGGGCDCGGWDMGCPLTILRNCTIWSTKKPFVESQQPLQLFIQGRKEEVPALTLTRNKEGHFAVDFHGQLSTLQAFSICVAILHVTEAFNFSVLKEKSSNTQLLQCNPTMACGDRETDFLIDGVPEEEKITKTNMKMGETLPSFVVNPPFSPISRV